MNNNNNHQSKPIFTVNHHYNPTLFNILPGSPSNRLLPFYRYTSFRNPTSTQQSVDKPKIPTKKDPSEYRIDLDEIMEHDLKHQLTNLELV